MSSRRQALRQPTSPRAQARPAMTVPHLGPAFFGPPPRPFSRRGLRALVVAALPFVLVLLGVALAVAVLLALGVALAAIGLLAAFGNYLVGSPARLKALVSSRPVDPHHDAGLANLAEGLCLAHGLPVPELRVIEDASSNIFLLGSRAADATLYCTSGLLERLDRIELEAVIAHELAHARRDDLRVDALALVGCGLWSLLSTRATRAVLVLAGPARQALADQTGVAMTRYPPGLIAALEQLTESPTRPALAPRVARLTAALWCVPLPEAIGAPRRGELGLAERIAALAEL